MDGLCFRGWFQPGLVGGAAVISTCYWAAQEHSSRDLAHSVRVRCRSGVRLQFYDNQRLACSVLGLLSQVRRICFVFPVGCGGERGRWRLPKLHSTRRVRRVLGPNRKESLPAEAVTAGCAGSPERFPPWWWENSGCTTSDLYRRTGHRAPLQSFTATGDGMG